MATDLERIAELLKLELPKDYTPLEAVMLDIQRLQEVEKRWNQACDIAREHCPVELGESHIRDGIPRLAKACAQAVKRLEQNTDWYQQRFNALRKWVNKEVKPLSKEAYNRYFAIIANGSPAPHESADWTGTMHSLGLKQEFTQRQLDEAVRLLQQVAWGSYTNPMVRKAVSDFLGKPRT